MHPLLEPRYIATANDTSSHFDKGDILENPGLKDDWKIFNPSTGDVNTCDRVYGPHNYPHLFKPLEWWQHRCPNEMYTVKKVKVEKFSNYWSVGDIVPVESIRCYMDGSFNFILQGEKLHMPFSILPWL